MLFHYSLFFKFTTETETSTKEASKTLDSLAKALEKVVETLSTKLVDTATTISMTVPTPCKYKHSG